MKLLISLTPQEPYFFGGEITFGKGKPKENKSDSFIVRSQKYPQQTGLLGFVRNEILNQNGIFDYTDKSDDIKNLTGDGQFTVQDKSLNYGKVSCISPLFLIQKKSDKSTYYFPNQITNSYKLVRENSTVYIHHQEKEYSYQLEGYDPKIGLGKTFISQDNAILKEDDFLTPVETIGIRKSANQESDEEGLFKKIHYKLKSNFSFGFVLTVNEDSKELIQSAMVNFGAEKTPFYMEVSESKTSIPDCLLENGKSVNTNNPILDKTPDTVYAIVLTSPAYLTQKVFELSEWILGEYIDFRYMETSLNDRFQLKKSTKKIKLLDSGSVVLCKEDNLKALCEELDLYKSMTQIGYNWYRVIF